MGALGATEFKKGRYIYVGSALNSLEPRIRRHLKISLGRHRVTHWHIDYLLREPEATIEAVYALNGGERRECAIAAEVSEHGEPVNRFGCSDCSCGSHLYRVDDCRFLEKMGMRRLRLEAFLDFLDEGDGQLGDRHSGSPPH